MNCDSVKISCGVQQIWDISTDNVTDLCQVMMYRINTLKNLFKSQNADLMRWKRPYFPHYETAKYILEHQVTKSLLPAVFIFSDADVFGKGIELAKYIKENKLGIVTETPSVLNANSYHIIRVWCWNVDKEAYVDWFKNQVKKGHFQIGEVLE